MSAKSELPFNESNTLEGRRSSLSTKKQKVQPEIPSYLKSVPESKETDSLLRKIPVKENKTKETSANSKGEITIIMQRSSIFAVFMGAALLAITSFVAGFITYRTFFTGSEEVIQPDEATVTTMKPKSPPQRSQASDQGQALSDEALNFADIFETPETEELIATAGGGQIAEDISSATDQVEQVKESVPDAPEELTTIAANSEITPKEDKLSSSNANSSSKNNDTGGKKPADSQTSSEQKEAIAINTTSSDGKKVEKAPEVGYYTINLGEASTEQQAKSMKEELNKLGIDTFVASSLTSDGREIYNIRQGKFSTYDEARTLLLNLPKPYSVWGRVEKDQTKKFK